MSFQLRDDHIERFASDGVVKLESVLAPERIDEVLELADRQLRTPGAWTTDTNPGATVDRQFTTRYLWPSDEVVRRVAFESDVPRIAAQLMGSSSVRLYFDHLLVKEPQTSSPTPWHQDIPYWPFLGKQICSIWVACSDVTVEESSLEFVRGSHRWDAYYAPVSFGEGSSNWTSDFKGEKCPDIAADRDAYDIVGFNVKAGDALAFSAWAVHGAPGNAGGHRRVALSTRWLGDDATWAPHPGSDPTVTDADTTATAGHYPDDDDRFPIGWSSGR